MENKLQCRTKVASKYDWIILNRWQSNLDKNLLCSETHTYALFESIYLLMEQTHSLLKILHQKCCRIYARSSNKIALKYWSLLEVEVEPSCHSSQPALALLWSFPAAACTRWSSSRWPRCSRPSWRTGTTPFWPDRSSPDWRDSRASWQTCNKEMPVFQCFEVVWSRRLM